MAPPAPLFLRLCAGTQGAGVWENGQHSVSTLSPTGMRLHWLGGGGGSEQTSTCHRNIVTVTLSE